MERDKEAEQQKRRDMAAAMRASIPFADGKSVEADRRIAATVSGDTHAPVSRAEFEQAMKTVALDIQFAIMKVQKWAMGSLITALLAVGGGGIYAYTNLISYLTELKPVMTLTTENDRKLDQRLRWMNERERHDMMQDQAIMRLDKNYAPPPTTERPD